MYFKINYSCDQVDFSASLLQSHTPSEIILICWFAAQQTSIIIINHVWIILLEYFCWRNHDDSDFFE